MKTNAVWLSFQIKNDDKSSGVISGGAELTRALVLNGAFHNKHKDGIVCCWHIWPKPFNEYIYGLKSKHLQEQHFKMF